MSLASDFIRKLQDPELSQQDWTIIFLAADDASYRLTNDAKELPRLARALFASPALVLELLPDMQSQYLLLDTSRDLEEERAIAGVLMRKNPMLPIWWDMGNRELTLIAEASAMDALRKNMFNSWSFNRDSFDAALHRKHLENVIFPAVDRMSTSSVIELLRSKYSSWRKDRESENLATISYAIINCLGGKESPTIEEIRASAEKIASIAHLVAVTYGIKPVEQFLDWMYLDEL